VAIGNSFLKTNGKEAALICRLHSRLFYEEAGLKKAPEFLQEEIFKTILWRKNASALDSQKVEVGDKVGDKITENQMQLLECIRKDPYISAQKIAEQIGISSRKTEDNIKKLKGLGMLERIGNPKTGYWHLIYKEE
jgi:predicted HTH transcriptional regulator